MRSNPGKGQKGFDLYRHEKCIYVLRIKKTGTPGPREKKGAASDGANIESGK